MTTTDDTTSTATTDPLEPNDCVASSATPVTGDLELFLPGVFGLRVVSINSTGQPAIVLSRSKEEPSSIAVHTGQAIEAWAPDTPVTLVTALSDQTPYHDVLSQFCTAVAEAQAEHIQVLQEIRQYAITAHENEEICRQGLDDFLDSFGLTPYMSSPVTINYEIRGSYTVECDNPSFAVADAKGYLRPDLSEIDDFLPESSVFTLVIRIDQRGASADS